MIGGISFARPRSVSSVNLSGSAGSPNTSTGLSVSSATAGFSFNLNGITGRYESNSLDANWGQNDISPQEWFAPSSATPGITYYIRAQNNSGSNPSSGPALNSWHALSATRTWLWTRSSGEGVGTTEGVLQVDIATDAGGSNIIATGYYKGSAQIIV